MNIFVVVNVLVVFARSVVGYETSVVVLRQDAGGVKMVVKGPRFADAKAEERDSAIVSRVPWNEREEERMTKDERK